MTEKCVCGSGKNYINCCSSLIKGEINAATAEALMRSRYTAYAELNDDYLLKTWHVSTRPEKLELDRNSVTWVGLKIINTEAGLADDVNGIVEFVARFKVCGKASKLHERSRFVKENGQWFYLDAEIKSDEKAKGNISEKCPEPI